jgi:murein DD-endopeptidase MepM/ murein hydrolase activator NlpD
MNKTGGAVMAAGLGGFLVGALTVLFMIWAYTGFRTQGGLPTAPPGAPGGQAEAAVPAPAPAPQPAGEEDPDLSRRNLVLPVQGVTPESLRDTFNDARSGGRIHEALDILAPRNTPVLAVEDGRVARLFTSKQGGLTIYQFDPSETYAYYYAHLESYAEGLAEGDLLRRGQVIGFVGTSGNAPPDAPHLHFAIFRLTAEKRWWEGEPVDPFAILGGRAEPVR